MTKINGQEQIGAADRDEGGYELGTLSKKEMDAKLNAFLDGRGVSRGQWSKNAAHIKPPTLPSDTPKPVRSRRAKTRVAALAPVAPDGQEPTPTAPTAPSPAPFAPPPVVEPVPVAAVEPGLDLPEAIAKLEAAICEYAFCKACSEHGDESPKAITEFAEELLASFNLPAEIFQTGEGC